MKAALHQCVTSETRFRGISILTARMEGGDALFNYWHQFYRLVGSILYDKLVDADVRTLAKLADPHGEIHIDPTQALERHAAPGQTT